MFEYIDAHKFRVCFAVCFIKIALCASPCFVVCFVVLLFRRILKYAGCSPECFVLALVYIDRLIQRNGVSLCSLNIHRIIITR